MCSKILYFLLLSGKLEHCKFFIKYSPKVWFKLLIEKKKKIIITNL
jgi:hypothetical protein